MNGFPFCKESFLFPVTFKKHIIKYYNQQSEKIGKESSHPHHYHPFGCQHTNPKAHWSSNGRSWNKQLLKSLKSPKTSIQNVPKFWLPIFRNQSINLHPTWHGSTFVFAPLSWGSSLRHFQEVPVPKHQHDLGKKQSFACWEGPFRRRLRDPKLLDTLILIQKHRTTKGCWKIPPPQKCLEMSVQMFRMKRGVLIKALDFPRR